MQIATAVADDRPITTPIGTLLPVGGIVVVGGCGGSTPSQLGGCLAPLAEQVVDAIFAGMSATVLLYGESSRFKAHLLLADQAAARGPGLGSSILAQIFGRPAAAGELLNVELSFVGIHHERAYDYFAAGSQLKPCSLPNATKFSLGGLEMAQNVLAVGTTRRDASGLPLDATCAILTFAISSRVDNVVTSSLLTIVDLPGIEHARGSASKGTNVSLCALRESVLKVAHHQAGAPPGGAGQATMPCTPRARMRAAKSAAGLIEPSLLTTAIKDSFGGNANVFVLAACPSGAGPQADVAMGTTKGGSLDALVFAENARGMVTQPVVNESSTDKIIRELRVHVVTLSQQLALCPAAGANLRPALSRGSSRQSLIASGGGGKGGNGVMRRLPQSPQEQQDVQRMLSFSLRNPSRPHSRGEGFDDPRQRSYNAASSFGAEKLKLESQKELHCIVDDYRRRVEELEQQEFETAESNARTVAEMEVEIVHLREKLRLAELKAHVLVDQSLASQQQDQQEPSLAPQPVEAADEACATARAPGGHGLGQRESSQTGEGESALRVMASLNTDARHPSQLIEFLDELEECAAGALQELLAPENIVPMLHNLIVVNSIEQSIQDFDPSHQNNELSLWDRFESVLQGRVLDVSVENRALLVHTISQTQHEGVGLQVLVMKILLATGAPGLLELKTCLDGVDPEKNSTANVVLGFLTDASLRERVLAHFGEQAKAMHDQHAFQPTVCILTDVDAALVETGRAKWGPRLPRNELVPGFTKLVQVLNATVICVASSTIVSQQLNEVARRRLGMAGVHFLHVFGLDWAKADKFDKYAQYMGVYPERQYLWLGDTGKSKPCAPCCFPALPCPTFISCSGSRG